MAIRQDPLTLREHLPSKQLSHWTTVINWLFCCVYLTVSFLKAEVVFYLSLYLQYTVPVTEQAFNMCLFCEWRKVWVIEFLSLPSNFCTSQFVHRYILSGERGRESRRKFKNKPQTLEKEMVRAICGTLWSTNCSHTHCLEIIKNIH